MAALYCTSVTSTSFSSDSEAFYIDLSLLVWVKKAPKKAKFFYKTTLETILFGL